MYADRSDIFFPGVVFLLVLTIRYFAYEPLVYSHFGERELFQKFAVQLSRQDLEMLVVLETPLLNHYREFVPYPFLSIVISFFKKKQFHHRQFYQDSQ